MIRSFAQFKPYHFTLGTGGGLSVRGMVLDVQSIQITFSQCVDITDTTGIQVNIGGAGWEEISAVSSGSAKTWIFATTTVIAESDTVEWQYLGGEDSIVDCVDAVDVGPLGPKTVTNGLELTAPTLDSVEVGTVADNVFVLVFSEDVSSADFTAGWTIEADAVELTIEDATESQAGTVQITTTESVYTGQTVTISYDSGVGDIVDVSGHPEPNVLADITDEAVTNNSETPIPILWSRDFTTLDLGADDTFGRASVGYHQQPTDSWVSIASGAPRFYGANWTGSAWDKTGATGPYGLLMEPLKTNLRTRSNDFVTLFASPTKVTIANSSEPSPLDGETMDLITEDNTAGEHYIAGAAAAGVGTGNRSTTSVYVKPNGRSIIRFYIAGMNNLVVFFNTATGVITKASGGSAGTESLLAGPDANGMYLLATSDIATSPNQSTVISLVASGTTINYTGDGVSGAYVSQHEIAAGGIDQLSSPILTPSTSAVSRAVDTLSYTQDELNNETRIIKRLVSDPSTEVIVDIDDWNYVVPAPTVPQFIQRIDVYAPGERPA